MSEGFLWKYIHIKALITCKPSESYLYNPESWAPLVSQAEFVLLQVISGELFAAGEGDVCCRCWGVLVGLQTREEVTPRREWKGLGCWLEAHHHQQKTKGCCCPHDANAGLRSCDVFYVGWCCTLKQKKTRKNRNKEATRASESWTLGQNVRRVYSYSSGSIHFLRFLHYPLCTTLQSVINAKFCQCKVLALPCERANQDNSKRYPAQPEGQAKGYGHITRMSATNTTNLKTQKQLNISMRFSRV